MVEEAEEEEEEVTRRMGEESGRGPPATAPCR